MSNPNQPNAPMPDHRMNEILEEMRRTRAENDRLRQIIDRQAQPQQPQNQTQSAFNEDVRKALHQEFEQMYKPREEAFKNQIGFLADKNDQLEFLSKYGQDTQEKFGDKIERVRAERLRMGQYISREDAYRHVYFEENARKPQVPKQESTGVKEPRFDPYTGMMIVPDTPAAQAPQAAPQTQQAPQQAQAPYQPPQAPGYAPQAPQGEIPPLPPSTPNPLGASAPQAATSQTITGLSLDSDAQALQRWEQRYGDQSL